MASEKRRLIAFRLKHRRIYEGLLRRQTLQMTLEAAELAAALQMILFES